MKEDPASLRNFDRSIFCDLFDNVPPLINKDQDTTMLHAISEEERLTVTLRYLPADNMYPGHFAASGCFCILATERSPYSRGRDGRLERWLGLTTGRFRPGSNPTSLWNFVNSV